MCKEIHWLFTMVQMIWIEKAKRQCMMLQRAHSWHWGVDSDWFQPWMASYYLQVLHWNPVTLMYWSFTHVFQPGLNLWLPIFIGLHHLLPYHWTILLQMATPSWLTLFARLIYQSNRDWEGYVMDIWKYSIFLPLKVSITLFHLQFTWTMFKKVIYFKN